MNDNDLPDEIEGNDGRWIKREALVAEMVEENPDVDEDTMDEYVEDLIWDGPMRSKEVRGVEYVQLTGRVDAVQFLARAKGQMYAQDAKDRVTRFLGGDE